MDSLTQAGYGVGRGSASAGAIDNTVFSTNSVISDDSIQARIQADINSGLLQQPDANRLTSFTCSQTLQSTLGLGKERPSKECSDTTVRLAVRMPQVIR